MKRLANIKQGYESWSKEELIEYVRKLEGLVTEKPSKKGKAKRAMDFSQYPKRRVAFKLAYFGWNYNGFASQISYKDDGNETAESQKKTNKSVVTVEDVFFEALLRTKLIESPKTCSYSRCGRTDAGVSSTEQIIALNLRSTKKITDVDNLSEEQDIANIVGILNRTLPEDIRILGYSSVPSEFNARFSCIGRKYKYFFSGHGLDIHAMERSAGMLVGRHDFRNFCRKDPSKNVQNYERLIYSSRINLIDGNTNFYEFEIHGSAFLYHQVRCTMAVLLMVGSGMEPPEVIEFMLDLEKCPEMPKYDMASEIPLVLYECFYPENSGLKITGIVEDNKLDYSLYSVWSEHYIKAKTAELVLNKDPSRLGVIAAPRLARHGPINRND